MASMLAAARAIHCQMQPPKLPPRVAPSVGDSSAGSGGGPDQVKIVLQPRLCTLRSYASDRGGVIRTITTASKEGGGGDGGEEVELTPFLANLYEYIESSKRSQDFEIITGRIAMILFTTTMVVELATGDSVFKKMDVQGMAEGLGACLAAVTCATTFAYSSSVRKKVGRIFIISCNAFIDTLIDNIIDSLFYESEVDEKSDNKDNL